MRNINEEIPPHKLDKKNSLKAKQLLVNVMNELIDISDRYNKKTVLFGARDKTFGGEKDKNKSFEALIECLGILLYMTDSDTLSKHLFESVLLIDAYKKYIKKHNPGLNHALQEVLSKHRALLSGKSLVDMIVEDLPESLDTWTVQIGKKISSAVRKEAAKQDSKFEIKQTGHSALSMLGTTNALISQRYFEIDERKKEDRVASHISRSLTKNFAEVEIDEKVAKEELRNFIFRYDVMYRKDEKKPIRSWLKPVKHLITTVEKELSESIQKVAEQSAELKTADPYAKSIMKILVKDMTQEMENLKDSLRIYKKVLHLCVNKGYKNAVAICREVVMEIKDEKRQAEILKRLEKALTPPAEKLPAATKTITEEEEYRQQRLKPLPPVPVTTEELEQRLQKLKPATAPHKQFNPEEMDTRLQKMKDFLHDIKEFTEEEIDEKLKHYKEVFEKKNTTQQFKQEVHKMSKTLDPPIATDNFKNKK